MDKWHGKQAGFRADQSVYEGALTVQRDLYENLVDTPAGRRSGGNVLGRWSKSLGTAGAIELQAYYDEQNRSDLGTAGGTSVNHVQTIRSSPPRTSARDRVSGCRRSTGSSSSPADT